MDDKDKIINDLQVELNRLMSELERTKEHERNMEESRQSLLYMLEDLNEATSAIKRAKTEWEETFDSISDPLFIHDKEFKIVRANMAYRNAAGMKFKEFIGKPYHEIFPKMDKPFNMCLKALELQEEEEEEEEEEFSYPVTNRIFKVRFYPIKDVNGGYLYSIHILEDITEAKKTAEKIEEAEIRYRTIFEQSPAGILIINPETFLPVEFNDIACGQLGYSQEEFAKLRVRDYEVVDTPEEIKARSEKLLREGKDSFETKHRAKNGEIRNVLVTVQTIILSGKPLFYCVFRDITEMRRAEEKIKTEMEITTHLLMIAEATTHATDIDKLMGEVTHCGHKIIGCNICLSYLWDKEAKVFKPIKAYGLEQKLIPIFMTETLDEKVEFVKKAMEGKEAVIIIEDERLRSLEDRRKNSTSQPHNFPTSALTWLPDINALIAIPLASKTDYLGLIVGIYTNPPQPPLTKSPFFPPLKKGDEGGLKGGKGGFVFTERDKKIMQGIMHQVSIALEQARLYKDSVVRGMELSHKIETIQVMHEIDRSILSTLDPDEILETVVRTIPRVIACDRATIATVDKNRKGFVYKAGFGTTIIVKGAFVPFRETTATEIIETGSPQYVPYLSEVKDLPSLERHLVKDGFMSHIRVPLMVKGEAIGVLSIGAKRPAAFTPDDLSMLEKIANQIGIALENARLLTDLDELFIGTVRALSSSIDAKSKWTAGHSERVTQYALKIAKEMGMDEIALGELELAGLLHDIGKIGTYEAILDKPGKLTEEEFKLMRQHPARGAEILASIKQLQDIIPGVKYHHESYNGTGYPEGLKGEAIPIYARILAVADTVDAMGADRPYRKGKPMEDIIAELKRCAGTQFDPNVVEGFLKTVGNK